MLVKPKCVWEVEVFFNFRKFVYIFQLFVYNFSKKPPTLKHILALPTWGQKCLVSEIKQIWKVNFYLGPPCSPRTDGGYPKRCKRGSKKGTLLASCFSNVQLIKVMPKSLPQLSKMQYKKLKYPWKSDIRIKEKKGNCKKCLLRLNILHS